MPPTVRTLDQLVAETNPIYAPQQQVIQQRIDQASQNNTAQEQGLAAAQTNAFGDITQAATRRGALFSGFTPDQQARYTSEKYLPALANLRAANQSTIQGLNDQSTALSSDQQKTALGQRDQDLSRLYDYQKVESDRKFQTEQANLAYQRELEKMRAEQSFSASQNAATTPTFQQATQSALAGALDPITGKTKKGFAEALVLQLQSAYPNIPRSQLTDYVYKQRKQAYGE